MAKVSRVLPFGTEHVFAALIDPETYPHWLIGARDIRGVDHDWPAPGSCFHHRVGLVGPFKVADSTKVLDVDPPRRLSLEVRVRPFGRGRATFTLDSRSDPSDSGADHTRVEIDEVPLGALTPLTPVIDPLTRARNARSLEQLADYLGRGISHRFPG